MRIVESIKETLQIEAQVLLDQLENIGIEFEIAVDLILHSSGKVVVTGMGKSGHVGKKIAATLSSTGTPSFFMHPAEAYHGDLGMISSTDVIIMLSNSGETDELLRIIPFFRDNGNKIIGVTARQSSTLAQNSDVTICMIIKDEACPLSLAPTSSTTLSMAIGDAIAIALMRKRNFQAEGFARYHPGGSLGKKLLSRVKHRMRQENLPILGTTAAFTDIIDAIGKGRLGLVLINQYDRTVGIITDGDLRRVMAQKGKDVWDLKAGDFMTNNPKKIHLEESLYTVESLLNENKITSLVVVDSEVHTVGIIQVYDLT